MTPNLWTTVDCACGKPAANANAHNVLEKDKSFSTRELTVDSLIDAVDVLAARLDALEALFDAFVCIIDRPLSPAESIEELRRLREQMV